MSTDSGPAIELDQRMLDQFRLLERSGRPGMLAQMIGMFVRNSADQIAAIAAASDAGDVEKLRVTSHTLKSTAASFGATALSEACRNIEHAAKAGTATLAAEQIAALIELHRLSCAALQREIR
jgi:HPt (histidine-containing phosphotransfer) domain-containing protein